LIIFVNSNSQLALITYTGAVFTTDDMLNTLALSQTTDVDKIAKEKFLNSQALAVLNSTLPDNLLIYSQPNAEALWAHLWTLMRMFGLASIFADY